MASRKDGSASISSSAEMLTVDVRYGMNIAEESSETYIKDHVSTEPLQESCEVGISQDISQNNDPVSVPIENRQYTSLSNATSNICTKANRTLGFLRRTLFSCPQNVKEAAYKGMVRPILEYGSSVWDPHPDKLKKELEKVQNRAARFVTRNYDYETGSMTGILGQLKWESLKKRRKDNRLILLYKGLKGKAKIPTDDLIPKTRHGRNQHSLAFQIPSASKDVYMYSFFPQTIRDWNNLPDSLISSSELSDDSVSKFTSLVRARD